MGKSSKIFPVETQNFNWGMEPAFGIEWLSNTTKNLNKDFNRLLKMDIRPDTNLHETTDRQQDWLEDRFIGTMMDYGEVMAKLEVNLDTITSSTSKFVA